MYFFYYYFLLIKCVGTRFKVTSVPFINPNILCSFPSSILEALRVSERGDLGICCFCLAAVTIDYVFSGWMIIAFLLHYTFVLFRMSCVVLFIEIICLFHVYLDESFAKIGSVYWFSCSGRS